MKHKLIKLVGAVVLAVALGGIGADAGDSRVLSLTGTNVVAATTNISGLTGDFVLEMIPNTQDYHYVTFQGRVALGGAGTSAVTCSFAQSLDGVNFEATPSITAAFTAAGTATNTTVVGSLTNISSAVKAIRWVSVTNANANATTLIEVKVGQRRR